MPAGRKRKLNDQEVLALKQKGLTNQEIADHFDVSLSTVRTTLKKFKGQYDAHKNIGRNRRLNITDSQRLYIFKLKDAGYSHKEIADKLGFSAHIVCQILNGNR